MKRFSVWSSRILAISWRLEASAFHFSTLLPLTYPKIAEVIKQKRAIWLADGTSYLANITSHGVILIMSRSTFLWNTQNRLTVGFDHYLAIFHLILWDFSLTRRPRDSKCFRGKRFDNLQGPWISLLVEFCYQYNNVLICFINDRRLLITLRFTYVAK